MILELGRKVRVTAADDYKAHLIGQELYLEEIGKNVAPGWLFVDGSPDPDEGSGNSNSDYGYVDAVVLVEPAEYLDRSRYLDEEGERIWKEIPDPEPTAQDGHVDDEDETVHDAENTTCQCSAGYHEPVNHVEPPPLPNRPRPRLTDLVTGKDVDAHWVLARLRESGTVEVGVQPDGAIPTTITWDDLEQTVGLPLRRPDEAPVLEPEDFVPPGFERFEDDKADGEDVVNHPSHYTVHPSGVECIDVVEWMSFNRGNAIKYLWRAGQKDPAREIEDLEKAAWYVNREIDRIRRTQA